MAAQTFLREVNKTARFKIRSLLNDNGKEIPSRESMRLGQRLDLRRFMSTLHRLMRKALCFPVSLSLDFLNTNTRKQE